MDGIIQDEALGEMFGDVSAIRFVAFSGDTKSKVDSFHCNSKQIALNIVI